MSFIWPLGLLTLLAIPLVAAAYVAADQRASTRRLDLGSMGWLRDDDGRGLNRRRHLPFALVLVALTLLLTGFARPEMVVDLPRVEGTVIIAVDNSNSMRATDSQPSRIEVAREVARGFVDAQPGTVRVGLVSFSNGAAVVARPTDSRDELMDTIDRIEPEGGTSISQGLFAALGAIAGEPIELTAEAIEAGDLSQLDIGTHSSGIVVLLSDGEDTDAVDPLQVAQLAAKSRIRIFPIAIGTDAGTVVEIDGFQIATSRNAAVLADIASVSEGKAFESPALAAATDSDAFAEIYDEIDLELTIRGEKMEVTALLGGAGALLLLLSAALSLSWFGRVL